MHLAEYFVCESFSFVDNIIVPDLQRYHRIVCCVQSSRQHFCLWLCIDLIMLMSSSAKNGDGTKKKEDDDEFYDFSAILTCRRNRYRLYRKLVHCSVRWYLFRERDIEWCSYSLLCWLFWPSSNYYRYPDGLGTKWCRKFILSPSPSGT
jgi:hypothetical protein